MSGRVYAFFVSQGVIPKPPLSGRKGDVVKNISLIVRFVLDLFGSSAVIKSGRKIEDLVSELRSSERVMSRRIKQAKSCPTIVIECLYDRVAVSRRDSWASGLQVPKFIKIESAQEIRTAINSILKIEVAGGENNGYTVIFGWNLMMIPGLDESSDSLVSLIKQRQDRFDALMASPSTEEEKAQALAARAASIAAFKAKGS